MTLRRFGQCESCQVRGTWAAAFARESQVKFDSPETWSNEWPALRMVSEQKLSRAASVDETMAGARALSRL